MALGFILGKLKVWEIYGSQVLTQNSLNQSYLSIPISVVLVTQMKLSVSVCLFVCIPVYMFHHFLRMTEYFFLKLCILNFEAFLRWSQT